MNQSFQLTRVAYSQYTCIADILIVLALLQPSLNPPSDIWQFLTLINRNISSDHLDYFQLAEVIRSAVITSTDPELVILLRTGLAWQPSVIRMWQSPFCWSELIVLTTMDIMTGSNNVFVWCFDITLPAPTPHQLSIQRPLHWSCPMLWDVGSVCMIFIT